MRAAYWIEEVLGGIWAIEYAPRPLFKWVWQRRLEESTGVARAFFVAQNPRRKVLSRARVHLIIDSGTRTVVNFVRLMHVNSNSHIEIKCLLMSFVLERRLLGARTIVLRYMITDIYKSWVVFSLFVAEEIIWIVAHERHTSCEKHCRMCQSWIHASDLRHLRKRRVVTFVTWWV